MIHPETYAARCFRFLTCSGIVWQQLAAADRSGEPLGGVAANAAVASSATAASGSLIGVTPAPEGLLPGCGDCSDPQCFRQHDAPGDDRRRRELRHKGSAAGHVRDWSLQGRSCRIRRNRRSWREQDCQRECAAHSMALRLSRGVALAPDGFSIAGVRAALHSLAGSVDRNLGTDGDGVAHRPRSSTRDLSSCSHQTRFFERCPNDRGGRKEPDGDCQRAARRRQSDTDRRGSTATKGSIGFCSRSVCPANCQPDDCSGSTRRPGGGYPKRLLLVSIYRVESVQSRCLASRSNG